MEVFEMKEPKILVRPPGPKSEHWIKRYKTSVSMPLAYNTLFSEGDGVYLKDLEGNSYISLTWASTHNIGYRHPEIVSAAIEQVEATGVGKFTTVHQTLVTLAERLREIVPPTLSKGKVSFCNTGSDSTEYAMQLARAYTGRMILIAHLGAHHGFSMGALSLTADRSERRRFCLPLVPSIVHVHYPNCYRCSFGQKYPGCDFLCLEHIRHTLNTVAPPEETAAFIIEAIQSQEVVVPPKEYFPELKKLCDEHGILFVDDEVMIGFGRTGKMWGIDHWGIEPDIMYMAKSIANGIPLAALIGTREIMELDEKHYIVRGSTFAGNPVSCACALAHLKVLQRENLVRNAAEVGDYILGRFRELSETHKIIGDVRGKGLIIGIELVKDQKSKRPATREAGRVVTEAFNRGVMLQTTGIYKQVLRIIPPLILTKNEAETAITILEEVLKEVK
ncbi:MAG: aspartate aminotransferase family protein [Candidatus Aerophobus sp.]|nr:MAG: aspartate aminotransferase family protein [Candidatus Aerophobus sp.]